jgi:hypothetical protein
MASSDSRSRGKLAEVDVHKIVLLLGSQWLPAPADQPAIDGIIDIYKHKKRTGLLLAVQVKAGQSYLVNRTKTAIQIRIDGDKLETLRQVRMPMILVYGDEVTRKFYWEDIAECDGRTQVTLRRKNVFGRHSLGDLYRLALRFGGNTANLPVVRLRRFSCRNLLTEVKQSARGFYVAWRRRGSYSPAYGVVKITLKGWRHIVNRRRSRDTLVHKLTLLPAARAILEGSSKHRLLRAVGSD